jgi:transmembrane sensor
VSAAANAAANAQDGRSAALKAAAQWHALLCSGTAGQEDQDACDAWRGRHPDHAWAWERLQALRQDLGSVPGPLSRATLQGAGRASGRRAFVKGIAVAAPTAVLAWGMTRSSGWQVWRADLRTATGEQRRVTLPDDSTLVLNTDSAVSLRFTAQERRIRLLAGEVYIETAHGAAAHGRPFIVESAQGNAQALGTRFTVRESNGAGAADVTRVAVQDGAVRILPGGSGQAQVVRAGQRVTCRPCRPRPTIATGRAACWWSMTGPWATWCGNWRAIAAAGWPATRQWRACACRAPIRCRIPIARWTRCVGHFH